MISLTKTATAFAALVALLYAFPANAAAPALTRIQLALWVDLVFLFAFMFAVVFFTGMIIRNRDRDSRHVDANPADRNIVRTRVTIMWICVAVAWAAVVATPSISWIRHNPFWCL